MIDYFVVFYFALLLLPFVFGVIVFLMQLFCEKRGRKYEGRECKRSKRKCDVTDFISIEPRPLFWTREKWNRHRYGDD